MVLARGEPYDVKNWKWQKIKFFINYAISYFPLGKKITSLIWHEIYKQKYQNITEKNIEELKKEIDVDKIYWLNPNKIKYASLKEFPVKKYRGKIIKGDWDKLEKPFDKLDVFIAFKERFIKGKDWEDTFFYNMILKDIENGKYLWECRNKTDLDRRCFNLESLYKDIKHKGYKSQYQILSEKKDVDKIKIEDEIAANIGRDGDLLFNNGAHRLSIVKLLDIKKIPIKITVIHPEALNKIRKGEIQLEKIIN